MSSNIAEMTKMQRELYDLLMRKQKISDAIQWSALDDIRANKHYETMRAMPLIPQYMDDDAFDVPAMDKLDEYTANPNIDIDDIVPEDDLTNYEPDDIFN